MAYAIGFSVQHKDNGNYVVWHSNGKGFEYTAPNHGVANLLTQWGINGTLITRRTDMWGNTYPIYGDDFDKNTNKVSCHTGGQPIDYNRYWAVNNAGGVILELELGFFMGGARLPGKGTGNVIKDSPMSRLDYHWGKHAKEFGNISKEQYLAKARWLVSQKQGGNILVKTRASDGAKVFYNKATNEFAVEAKDGLIKTFFKPDPKVHGYKTNLDYFNAQ